MNGIAPRFVRFSFPLLGLVTLGWVLTGQAAKPVQQKVSLPNDWTHHHLIFSQPATAEQARLIGNEPRYWMQWARQHQVLRLRNGAPASSAGFARNWNRTGTLGKGNVHRDWAEFLGDHSTPVGAGVFPAKFGFDINTANCDSDPTPDFVIYSTGLMGSNTQASIVAFDNLYAGCTGTVPLVYWAYNTGGQILTSPVYSIDGKQVIFVQTDPILQQAALVLLKWQPSTTDTVGSPTTPPTFSTTLYPTCVAPCMAKIPLRAGTGTLTDDTTSSVFYDFTGDIAWIGDNESWLHKVINVFNGVPTEVRTAPWPVHVNPGNPLPLSSPVFDHISNDIFLGDQGGFFYRVSKASGTVFKSAAVDFGAGLMSGPIVDSTAGRAYAFASSDGTTNCAGGPCAAVIRFPANFGNGATGTKAIVGTGTTAIPSNPMYEGAFDSTYNNSSNATGNLYVCGNTGGAPTLYQVPITTGNPGTPVAGPQLASATTGCSPVTDIPNPNVGTGGTEWIFSSVQDTGLSPLCAADGCITNFKDTPWQASTSFSVGQQVLDTHFQIQTVRTAGTSKTGAHPAWATILGGSTSDNTVRWLNQGPLLASYAGWTPSTAFALNARIVDSNGNIQLVIIAGTSKSGAHPAWNALVNGTTNDGGLGGVRWRNVGAIATAGLAAAGGTGAIIMDNVVVPDGSQVYFTTQGNQNCDGGFGGCAVQASQSALQ